MNAPRLKQFTCLMLAPEGASAGTGDPADDVHLRYLAAFTPEQAIAQARRLLAKQNLTNPDDWVCLFCTPGLHENLTDRM